VNPYKPSPGLGRPRYHPGRSNDGLPGQSGASARAEAAEQRRGIWLNSPRAFRPPGADPHLGSIHEVTLPRDRRTGWWRSFADHYRATGGEGATSSSAGGTLRAAV